MNFPALSIIHKLHCAKYLQFEEYAYSFFLFPFLPPCFCGLRRPTNTPMPSGVKCKAGTKIGCTMCLHEIHRISKHFGTVIKGWTAKYKGDCSTHRFQIISNMQIAKQTTFMSSLHFNLQHYILTNNLVAFPLVTIAKFHQACRDGFYIDMLTNIHDISVST